MRTDPAVRAARRRTNEAIERLVGTVIGNVEHKGLQDETAFESRDRLLDAMERSRGQMLELLNAISAERDAVLS